MYNKSSSLGLDVGDRRVGVALSDPDGMVAVPLITIQENDRDAAIQVVADLVERYGVGLVVVGLPVLMGGGEGEQARKAREFARALSESIQQPIVWWDERLSTVAAEKLLREGGTRKGRRKGNRDSLAAALILQAYLDHERASSL